MKRDTSSFISVSAECTNFIGPAGYGYVQGTTSLAVMSDTSDSQPYLSEPATRTRSGCSVVDGLSTRLIQPHFQTRESGPVFQVGLLHRRNLYVLIVRYSMISTCHAAGVKVLSGSPSSLLDFFPSNSFTVRYDLEPHVRRGYWNWHCRILVHSL